MLVCGVVVGYGGTRPPSPPCRVGGPAATCTRRGPLPPRPRAAARVGRGRPRPLAAGGGRLVSRHTAAPPPGGRSGVGTGSFVRLKTGGVVPGTTELIIGGKNNTEMTHTTWLQGNAHLPTTTPEARSQIHPTALPFHSNSNGRLLLGNGGSIRC